MKINFDCPTEQIQVSYSILLKPGENDLPDDMALELIAGSEVLVAGIAKANNISEDKARESMKGQGLFTAITSHAPKAFIKKGEKGVKDNG